MRLHDFAIKKTMRILELEIIPHEYVNAQGYDLLVEGKKVEVKFDTWIGDTGNISAEYWVLIQNGQHPGWAQYSDAHILLYLYDFDNAFAVDMQGLKDFVHRNYDRLPQKKAYGKERGAINSLVHLSLIPDLRLRDWEERFRRHAVLPSKDEKSFRAPLPFRSESSLT